MQAHIVHGHGGLGGQGREQLEVFFIEGHVLTIGVHIYGTENTAFNAERHGHGAVDAIDDDAFAPAEFMIGITVFHEHRLAVNGRAARNAHARRAGA